MCCMVQERVFPRLGVGPTLVSALQAWVHLQQYLKHGDVRMLQQAKAHLKAHAESDSTARSQSAATPDLLSMEVPSSNQQQSAIVRSAIKQELMRNANDAFVQCTPEQVPHVLDMVLFASEVPADGHQHALETMFVSSTDNELQRCWQSACNAASSPSARRKSSAQSTMAVFLLTVEVRLFSIYRLRCSCVNIPQTFFPGAVFDLPTAIRDMPVAVNMCLALTYVLFLQEMMAKLRAFTSVLDRDDTLHQSASMLLKKCCYAGVGRRFTDWLQHVEDPLSNELPTIRDAAAFATRHANSILTHDITAQLQVCGCSLPKTQHLRQRCTHVVSCA